MTTRRRPVPKQLEDWMASATREQLIEKVREMFDVIAKGCDVQVNTKDLKYKCHYCGRPTSVRPYICDAPPGKTYSQHLYPSCCLTCSTTIDWDPIPVDQCPEDLIQIAQSARA